MASLIESRLKTVFEKIFGNSVLFSLDLTMKGTKEWDSLKHVVFMFEIEKQFSVHFDAADVVRLNSIGALVQELSGDGD